MNAPASEKIKIALIDPDPAAVARIKEMAAASSLPAVVSDVMSGETPELKDADLIVISLASFDETSREAVVRVRSGFPAAPLIVLSGPGGSTWTGEVLGLGAQHVLDKGALTPEKLSSTIRYYARYARRTGP